MNEQLPARTTATTNATAAAAVPKSTSRRPIIPVLGMHRSGTSLCAHVLSCLGVDMADEVMVNNTNAKGHWERLELMALHDRMLALCNRGYFTPLHDLALPAGWWADPQVQAVKREIIEFLRRRMGAMPFGFKDPRTARLMPVWNQIFRELNLAPKFVLCLRNPAQVARSLRDRDHLDPQIGEYRWFVYLADILSFITKYEFCLVEYEDWFSAPERNLDKLQQFLEIEWPGGETDLRLAVSEIVDSELRHDDPHYTQAREPTIRWLYELVRSLPGDSAARQQVRHLVIQFAAYRQLQRPFECAFENAIALADQVAPLKEEIAVLRGSGERNEAELARMHAEAATARVELDAREAAVAAAEQRAAEQAAMTDCAEADLAQLRAEFAVREAALAESERTAAEQALAALRAQADLAQLRTELTVREAALTEQAAAAQRAQADLAQLRAELAARDTALAEAREQLDRAAQEQSTAAAAARAEVERLRNDLAVARQTAGAAITALRTDFGAAANGSDGGRWRIWRRWRGLRERPATG
jgi:hypothetical protein